jgi:hypothetical protein
VSAAKQPSQIAAGTVACGMSAAKRANQIAAETVATA